jgi:hypothetical protein
MIFLREMSNSDRHNLVVERVGKPVF